MALAFSSRMSDISAINKGTGQERIQIWSESLGIWRQYPVFGLGEGLIVDEIGVVSHNSFLQCFAELGFFGGTAFVSCFLVAGLVLWSQRRMRLYHVANENSIARAWSEHRRLCGFLFAALMACIAAMLTISRQFVAPTYLILGLVSAAIFIPLDGTLRSDVVGLRVGNRFLVLSLVASATSLLAFYVIVRVFVHW
jgi:putative inorganic carbon (HCO3(-)) transporter